MTRPKRRANLVGMWCLFLVCAVSRGDTAAPTGLTAGPVLADAFRILRDIVGPRPAPRAIVTVRSDTVKGEAVANAHGAFVVRGLPLGPCYGVSAMMPPASDGRRAKPKVSAPRKVECGDVVRLVLHEELITVSGQITDTLGQPVSGAQVTGTVVPMSEVGVPETRMAVSDATGRYTLSDLEPVNLYRVAGYLNGGNLEATDALHTQVEIKVEAPGFRQDQGRVPKVPLISETQLVPGRRLWQALSDRATKMNRPDRWKEMKPVSLPASRGSAIMDVNIVLER
jgi:hypothetical protein